MKSKIVLTESFRLKIHVEWSLPRELKIRLLRFLINNAFSIPKEHMRQHRKLSSIFWLTVPMNDEQVKRSFHIFTIAIQFSKNSKRARLLTGKYIPAPPPEPEYEQED